MGTRVCAWIGNPHDYENREYLGSLGYDGYNIPPLVAKAKSAEDFRRIWLKYAEEQHHFCTPDRPFPFPWADDIFITDITVAWFAPDGHSEGAYRDASMYRGMSDHVKWEAHTAPIWPDKYIIKKAVWLSCAAEERIQKRARRRQRDIKRAIQDAWNEIPGDDNTDEWQALAEAKEKEFDARYEASQKLFDKQYQDLLYASAPIPGPAIAHSAYVEQADKDSIILIG